MRFSFPTSIVWFDDDDDDEKGWKNMYICTKDLKTNTNLFWLFTLLTLSVFIDIPFLREELHENDDNDDPTRMTSHIRVSKRVV